MLAAILVSTPETKAISLSEVSQGMLPSKVIIVSMRFPWPLRCMGHMVFDCCSRACSWTVAIVILFLLNLC